MSEKTFFGVWRFGLSPEDAQPGKAVLHPEVGHKFVKSERETQRVRFGGQTPTKPHPKLIPFLAEKFFAVSEEGGSTSRVPEEDGLSPGKGSPTNQIDQTGHCSPGVNGIK